MEKSDKLYPNCDLNVWLRTCEKEVIEPIQGAITGEVPTWVHGTLLRNGPGSLRVGSLRFSHVFDGSALMHRFHIKDGRVTYKCRFVQTEAWKKNHAANRIVFTEFGTKSVPDPCHTIFNSRFNIQHLTDNTMVSVYPFGDQIYTLTEVTVLHRIDPETLETNDRNNVLDSVVVTHTAHPHVMPNGTFILYSLYFTHLILINRKNGCIKRYRTDTIMFFHMVNSYEEHGKVVIDLCTYKDAKIIDAMYVKAIEEMQSNKDYATWTRSRPRREIPLEAPDMTKVENRLLADIGIETPQINYQKFNGRPYIYFYGCGTDNDIVHALPIIKIDVKTGETITWYEQGWSPGEPIFVAHPDAKSEDHGVLLSAMVRECAPDSPNANELALLVLDASDLRELARAIFHTPTAAAKSLHGWFLPQ